MKLTFYSVDIGRKLDVEEIWLKSNRFTVRGPDGFITVLDGADRLIDNMCDEIRRECAEIAERVVERSPMDKYEGRFIFKGFMTAAIMGEAK